jgi:acyl-CoA reductase-like NAD-dependent aldehyde dehydrogenase
MTLADPTITVIDPATAHELASYAEHGPEQIEAALVRAHAAHRLWRERPQSERAAPLTALAGVLRAGAEEYAELVTREVGKRSPKPALRSRSAHWAASTTRRRARACSPTSRSPRTRSPPISRSA